MPKLRACLKNVAAGGSPAVEDGILPPGNATDTSGSSCISSLSAGQDAQLYGRRDARRYDHDVPSAEF